MYIGNVATRARSREARRVRLTICCDALSAFVCGLLIPVCIGCGAPGEPTPPTPPTPVAVADLSAHQLGDGVQLKFTVPAKTVAGDKLTELPAVEVLRGEARTDGTPDAKSFRVVETVPGAMLADSLVDERVELLEAVSPDVMRTHPGAILTYT